jgi:IclR family transcriptional regulator, acetate operon repressor
MSSVKEIQSVHHACTLVEAVAAHQPIGVSDLARATGIDKSAAHRLAVTLHRAGWLAQDGDGRWRVAPALGRVVRHAATASLLSTVQPVMVGLRDQTGETVMLVAVDHARLIVHQVVDSHHALRITAVVGAELPIVHSSAVRAIAAHLPADELATLRLAIPSLDDDRALQAVRRRGWAMNDREIVPDARVVGAPVLSSDGYPLAAVIVCGPTTRITRARMERYGKLVAEAARSIVA